ncbi:hypothetical protein NVP1264O_39 [Vibrio phage 1.264.O._10N.286.51.F2]|nr:hypothetical protein NVP1264O_39 [Vibrio phage 1.264.O._10N.286.51.F2]
MEYRTEWLEVYLHEGSHPERLDLHQKFADMIGVSRQEAKVIHCKNMWSVPMIRANLEETERIRDAVKILQEVGYES